MIPASTVDSTLFSALMLHLCCNSSQAAPNIGSVYGLTARYLPEMIESSLPVPGKRRP
jgi:hypothetical protein